MLPLVHLRRDQPELLRTTLLAWLLVWSWQQERVQAIGHQLQRRCGTQDELRQQYLQLAQQWDVEEAKPITEDQLSCVQVQPQSPPSLSFLQPSASAPSRWVISCCSVQWLQAVVQGQWSWRHLLASLPRLARFFCPSPRRRRCQRFQLEAWLCFRLVKLIPSYVRASAVAHPI